MHELVFIIENSLDQVIETFVFTYSLQVLWKE